jgi:hypothetical protein
MKKFIAFATNCLLLLTFVSFGQSSSKTYKTGHVFSITLPDYMSRTVGLNSSANFQYKSEVKDVYGFVIVDDKEELKLAELNFASVTEFNEDFMKSFLADVEKKNIGTPVIKKIGENSFLECDVTYFDKESEGEIYYLVGVVETKSAFYKILSWSLAENKDKFKSDFQKILYSLKK